MIDLDKNKLYFIKGGSSYALDYNVGTNGILLNKNIQRVDLDCPSVGINYIRYSVIKTIEFLIENEIPSKNIYVLTDLSQIGRFFVNDTESKEDYYLNNELNQNININNQFYINFFSNGIVDVNGFIFDYLIRGSYNSYSGKLQNKLKLGNVISRQKDSLEYIEEYLVNLVEFQNELNKLGVGYNFFPMNNIFEGWFIQEHIIKHAYSYHYEYSVPSISNLLSISELSTKCNDYYNKIDFSKICFYSTIDNNYGGMDEFAVDNYKISDFTDINTNQNNTNMFGFHPRQYVRNDYFNRYIKDSYINFLTNNNHLE